MDTGTIGWNNKITCPSGTCLAERSAFEFNADSSVVYVLGQLKIPGNICSFLAFNTNTGAIQGNRYSLTNGCGFLSDLEFRNNKLYMLYKDSTQYIVSLFDPVTNTMSNNYSNSLNIVKFIRGQSDDK